MTWINEHRGIVKRCRNNKVTVTLPRGGTFTCKTDREFKVGEIVCFVFNPVTKNVLEVMPAKDADEIVSIGQDESAYGVLIEDYAGIDLEDDDSGFAEEDFDYLFGEEVADDEYGISDQGQGFTGNFDFECGEPRSQVIEPGDYFADEDNLEKPDGPEN